MLVICPLVPTGIQYHCSLVTRALRYVVTWRSKCMLSHIKGFNPLKCYCHRAIITCMVCIHSTCAWKMTEMLMECCCLTAMLWVSHTHLHWLVCILPARRLCPAAITSIDHQNYRRNFGYVLLPRTQPRPGGAAVYRGGCGWISNDYLIRLSTADWSSIFPTLLDLGLSSLQVGLSVC